ncbi:GNAT family N-acetyltransferase [Halostella sp. JP-L12]|uniref:GNAT family N-acetyltransferase n=1 Tax=Halostella TaxID=1843185 RepID=UPI0013CE7F16|nr:MULTISPECIES: GNAT family N-acetyltransferase [Halostella]NHN48522.1 GNAT family N-acetyltransferase [Halostella sp. JP-L12]
MEVREPDSVDGEVIRDIAGRSLRASYGLSPDTIDATVRQFHDDERLDELIDDEDSVLVVAEDEFEGEEEVVGFAQGELADDGHGEVNWHHVAPEARGQGVGTELFEEIEAALQDRGGESIRANVLSDNMEGAQFFERFGYAEDHTSDVEIDGEDHAVNVFVPEDESESDAGDQRLDPGEIPETVEDEGETKYVKRDHEIPGEKGPFFELYSDEALEDLYAYWCSHSENVVAAGDDQGRLECSECGNVHRADEWDDGYL